jgi:SP family sugar:H+ symporter-like MFS transporter
MSICQYVVAITGTVAATEDQSAQRTAIAFVCIYIFFFASSWGPVAWVVTGELFPLKVRAKALSMTTASNWLLNFSIAYATPYMVNEGKGYANLQSKVFFVSSSHASNSFRQTLTYMNAGMGLILFRLYCFCLVYDLRDERPVP